MGSPPDKPIAPVRPRRNWLSFSLRSLLIVVTLSCLAVGGKLQYDWYRKKWLVQEWVAPLARQAHTAVDLSLWERKLPPLPPAPPRVQREAEIDLLKIGVLELDTSEERFSALRILVESRGPTALPILRGLVGKCRHADTEATLLHLISLDRNQDDIPLIEPHLDSLSAIVRAAAAESLGYLHEESYGFAYGWQMNGRVVYLDTAPPIDASKLVRPRPQPPYFEADRDAERRERRRVFEPIRKRIEKVMLQGPMREEREAAARALVACPPEDYSLRVAEWGVWIDGQNGLQLAESVLAEIPPFVHGAGNSIASLPRNRYEGPIAITKPIIHLTADRPLAVDLEAAIARGRPWYVFPRPDGFTVHQPSRSIGQPGVSEAELEALRPSQLGSLAPVSEGYPWVHPLARSEGASKSVYVGGSDIGAVGLRWQSLIVTPERQSWMTPPEVPESPLYGWWTALRKVPGCWIASQDEAERFLYYDGPSLARSPHAVSLNESLLTIKVRDMLCGDINLSSPLRPRECLLVDCTAAEPRACAFAIPSSDESVNTVDLAGQEWQSGPGAESGLLRILLDRGLTVAEAEGLVTSWRVRFFKTPGRRLLTFLTPGDYGRFCPLKIRPEAQEIVRVGIVLTEL